MHIFSMCLLLIHPQAGTNDSHIYRTQQLLLTETIKKKTRKNVHVRREHRIVRVLDGDDQWQLDLSTEHSGSFLLGRVSGFSNRVGTPALCVETTRALRARYLGRGGREHGREEVFEQAGVRFVQLPQGQTPG